MRRASVVVATCLLAGVASAAVVAGHQAPERVRVGGEWLTLNGTAVHKKLWVSVLGAALYLEEPTRSQAQALSPGQSKQVRLFVLRDIGHEQFGNTLFHGFERTLSQQELRRMKPQILELIDSVWSLEKGEQLVISHTPGEGVTVSDGRGVKARIQGEDFARALFSIWIGPNSPMPQVRDKLLNRG